MKFYGEPIIVRTEASGRPISVIWRGKPYRIKSIDEVWCWRGKWWTTPGLCGHQRVYENFQNAPLLAAGMNGQV